MLYDAAPGLADHWIDLVVAALLALVGYFGAARFSDMEKRHARAEDKFDEIGDDIGKLKVRATRIETVCKINHDWGAASDDSSEG